MEVSKRAATVLLLMACFPLVSSAQKKQELSYQVGPGGSVTISNSFGRVSVRPGSGRQVQVSATTRSDAVEVDGSQAGNRVIVKTHYIDRNRSAEDRTVDYDVTVPVNSAVTVRTGTGPVTLERINGDISVESEKGTVEVRDMSSGHVNVRNMAGATRLTNISGSHVEVSSVSGDVHLDAVNGPKVKVGTTSGVIRYAGSFGADGEYSLTNGTGDIEVALPQNASVDITARSIRGTVENDFPFQKKAHETTVLPNLLTGVSNSGSSTVQLQSFSGRIRVKKK
jgi:DUF4097 and DUF4098 domain-containing protein YvlB